MNKLLKFLKSYKTFAVEDFETFQPKIPSEWTNNTVLVNGTHPVGTQSIRVLTFEKGSKCSYPGCTMVTRLAAAQRDTLRRNGNRLHVNFYGMDEEGNWDMMTCDHILARSLGGANDLSNTQIMCSHHNSVKALAESVERARQLLTSTKKYKKAQREERKQECGNG